MCWHAGLAEKTKFNRSNVTSKPRGKETAADIGTVWTSFLLFLEGGGGEVYIEESRDNLVSFSFSAKHHQYV